MTNIIEHIARSLADFYDEEANWRKCMTLR